MALSWSAFQQRSRSVFPSYWYPRAHGLLRQRHYRLLRRCWLNATVAPVLPADQRTACEQEQMGLLDAFPLVGLTHAGQYGVALTAEGQRGMDLLAVVHTGGPPGGVQSWLPYY